MLTTHKNINVCYLGVAAWRIERKSMFQSCGDNITVDINCINDESNIEYNLTGLSPRLPFVTWVLFKTLKAFKNQYADISDFACLKCVKMKDKLIIYTEPIFVQ